MEKLHEMCKAIVDFGTEVVKILNSFRIQGRRLKKFSQIFKGMVENLYVRKLLIVLFRHVPMVMTDEGFQQGTENAKPSDLRLGRSLRRSM